MYYWPRKTQRGDVIMWDNNPFYFRRVYDTVRGSYRYSLLLLEDTAFWGFYNHDDLTAKNVGENVSLNTAS